MAMSQPAELQRSAARTQIVNPVIAPEIREIEARVS